MVLNELLNILPISRSPSIFRLVKHAIYPWSMEKPRFSPCQTTHPTQPPLCAHAEPSRLWTSPRVELAAQLSPRRWDDHPIEDWKHPIGWGLNFKKKLSMPKKKSLQSIYHRVFSFALPCQYVYIYIYTVYILLVVYLPLWKIWLRQLGLWNSQYVEKYIIHSCSKAPTRIL